MYERGVGEREGEREIQCAASVCVKEGVGQEESERETVGMRSRSVE
jgi:hypothetical protein